MIIKINKIISIETNNKNMTELINQLVEEMEGMMDPKYVAIKVIDDNARNMKVIYFSNNKEQLKNKLLDKVIKDLSLEEYLSVEQIKDCIVFPVKTECNLYVVDSKGFIKNVVRTSDINAMDFSGINTNSNSVVVFTNTTDKICYEIVEK